MYADTYSTLATTELLASTQEKMPSGVAQGGQTPGLNLTEMFQHEKTATEGEALHPHREPRQLTLRNQSSSRKVPTQRRHGPYKNRC